MDSSEETSTKREMDWMCVVFNLQVFISCLWGLYLAINEAYLLTSIFGLVLVLFAMLGVNAGAHRLWAHHSYKASTSLRIFLMLCQTLTGHTTIYNWVRLHRLHHKYFQTDLDPFYPNKGFIYSHFISNVLKLSPAQEKSLKEIDMSDIEKDKVVMFQKNYFWFLLIILTFLLPINAPVEYWDETILNSVFIIGWLRFGVTYHLTLLIHSGINIFDLSTGGTKTAFKSNMVFFVDKTYWLSYHYVSPWDYQTSEFGKYGTDCTSKFIRVCAALEYATDLRTVDSKLIKDALTVSLIEDKPISECLLLIEENLQNVSKDFFLTPSKYY